MNKKILVVGKEIDFYFDKEEECIRYTNEVIYNREYRDIFFNKTVIDIGANLGTFSLWIYDYAKVIYAVEAQKDNFDNLVKTIEVNGLTKIKPFHLAIAGSNGIGKLSAAGDCGGYYLGADHYVEDTETMTLNTFMIQNNIEFADIVKIDVEGAEKEIFEAGDFAEISHRVPYIIGEIHNNIYPILEKVGYYCRDLGDQKFLAVKV